MVMISGGAFAEFPEAARLERRDAETSPLGLLWLLVGGWYGITGSGIGDEEYGRGAEGAEAARLGSGR
jgi:hypothetical protein